MSIFAPGGGGGSSSSSSEVLISSPTIANISVTDADTEESYALPAGSRYFRLVVRDSPAVLKLAFASGQSGTSFLTVYPGFTYTSPPFGIDVSTTLYFQVSRPAVTVEIESWA